MIIILRLFLFLFRFRTRSRTGQLMVISSQHRRDLVRLQLIDSYLCLSLNLRVGSTSSYESSVCLTEAALTDGAWHSVRANRLVLADQSSLW